MLMNVSAIHHMDNMFQNIIIAARPEWNMEQKLEEQYQSL